MRYRLFGGTGFYVSELCLGCMTFGGRGMWEAIGTLGKAEVERLVGTALDAGVNVIDTADVYSEGESENLLGAALAALNRPRNTLVIATKVRGRTGKGPNEVGLSRGRYPAGIDASLRRLGLDYVDLYQIHGIDYDTPIEETLRALDDVVRSGKVRYIGFCNLPAWYAMKALGLSATRGSARFVSAQMYYSIAGRDIEREIVPLAKEENLAILPWSPLAGGLLSGKFDLEGEKAGPLGARRTTFDFPPLDRAWGEGTRRHAAYGGFPEHLRSPARPRVDPHKTVHHQRHHRRADAQQLLDNLAATDVVLDADRVAALDAVSALPSEYPGWMLERQDRDRRPERIADISRMVCR